MLLPQDRRELQHELKDEFIIHRTAGQFSSSFSHVSLSRKGSRSPRLSGRLIFLFFSCANSF